MNKNYKKMDLNAEVILKDCLAVYTAEAAKLLALQKGSLTDEVRCFNLPGVRYKIYDESGIHVDSVCDRDFNNTAVSSPAFLKRVGSSFFRGEMVSAVRACSKRNDLELETTKIALASIAEGPLHITSFRVNGGAVDDGRRLTAGVANIHLLPVWGLRETDDRSLESFFAYSQHGGILRRVDGSEVRYCTNPVCIFTHSEAIDYHANQKEGYDNVVDVIIIMDMEYLSSLLLAQCRASRQADRSHYEYRVAALRKAWDPQLTLEVPFDMTRLLCFLYKAVSDTMSSIGVGGRLFPDRNAAHYCYQALSGVSYSVWDVANTAARFCAPYVVKRLQAEDDMLMRAKPFNGQTPRKNGGAGGKANSVSRSLKVNRADD